MKERTYYYVVEFEWVDKNTTPSEDEFFPVMIYRLHELAFMLEEHFRCSELYECPYDIITIRPATDEEVELYPHYYC